MSEHGGRLAIMMAITAAALIVVPVPPAQAAQETFLSSDSTFRVPITGAPMDNGPAAIYPSTITVSQQCDAITDVNMEIQVDHDRPDDLDIMLVSPGGQNAMVMSDSGGGIPISGETIQLDDEATNPLPDNDELHSDFYKPTNHQPPLETTFPPGAPTPSGLSALSTFDGSNPNGTWSLFIQDDADGQFGFIHGWELTITSAQGSEICIPPGPAVQGPAGPYPATKTVSGVPGPITDVNLTITGFTHIFPDDVDVLLVGPGGQNAIVMSDAGAGASRVDLTFTLDDQATGPLPDNAAITQGSFQPANHGSADFFPPPAPTPSGGSALAVFNGTDANGTWSLFVFHDGNGFYGRLNDWSLEISPPVPTPAPPAGTSATTLNLIGAKAKEGKPITFQVGLATAPTQVLTVPFATVPGSAKSGKDFKAASGNLTFNPGETSKTVVVKTKNDPKDEKKETFSVQLTTPTGPISATGKIKDNDKST